jgi:hypothetical protein
VPLSSFLFQNPGTVKLYESPGKTLTVPHT